MTAPSDKREARERGGCRTLVLLGAAALALMLLILYVKYRYYLP